MRKINHLGVPTTTPQPGEQYAEGLKVWLTNFNESPNKIEYLRFEADSWMPQLIQKAPHIAYEVDDLQAELKDAKVLVEPMPGGENLTIAFIEEEGIALELMQFETTPPKNKFINDPDDLTAELLEGYVMAYSDQVAIGGENIIVRAHAKADDKVAIITLGGSGHEPALSGFVGDGMLDCSVVGDIFAAPGAQRLFQALQMFKREAGILLVVLNHSGDVMSANMACQLAERTGIRVKTILTHDDISAGLHAPDDDRRGLAGCVPLIKIVGAAAEEGKSLDEIIEIGQRFNARLATLAVAMNSCTHPQNGMTISNLPEGEIEIGMGQHGEGGGGRKQLVSADDTAREMIGLLMKKLQPKPGDKALLIINGVGATTHMEMNIVYRKAHQMLENAGLEVASARIGELLTVQEQAGFQMILALLDDDHVDYLNNYMSDAPYWTTIGRG